MSGTKQFFLEFCNFIVNMILAVIVFILLNLVLIEIVEDRKVLLIINIFLGIAILFYFYFQNVYFPSLFYIFSRYRIGSTANNQKLKIFANNFLFNSTLIGMIVTEVLETNYWIKLIFILMIILDFIFCFISSEKKSLYCKLFKIETIKISK